MRTEKSSGCSKAEFRALALERRTALPVELHAVYSRAIWNCVFASEEFQRAPRVMAYCSFGSEIDTSSLLRQILGRGKTLLLPKINRGLLEVYLVKDLATDLVAGMWGILEPDPARCEAHALAEKDLAVLPGVAFDRHGGRVGYGKGYYDRLLAKCNPVTVAAAFEVQVFDQVPTEPHDARIDRLITEAS
jgi:5,10-methenyltetrahydrofolate synthetase